MKKKWIEAVRKANIDNYSGSGYICQFHFSPNVIVSARKNGIKLISSAVPTEFFTEVIEQYDINSSIAESHCENCEQLKKKVHDLENIILKMKLDQEIKDQKSAAIIDENRETNRKFLIEIKSLKCTINDISKLKTRYEKNVSLIIILSPIKAYSLAHIH